MKILRKRKEKNLTLLDLHFPFSSSMSSIAISFSGECAVSPPFSLFSALKMI